MQSAFESWVGQHVLVRLTFGKIKLSLRGVLLKDRTETLLMGPEFGSELEIPKKMILAIEEVGVAQLPVMLGPFARSAQSAQIQNTGRDVGWTNPFKLRRLEYNLYLNSRRVRGSVSQPEHRFGVGQGPHSFCPVPGSTVPKPIPACSPQRTRCAVDLQDPVRRSSLLTGDLPARSHQAED